MIGSSVRKERKHTHTNKQIRHPQRKAARINQSCILQVPVEKSPTTFTVDP